MAQPSRAAEWIAAGNRAENEGRLAEACGLYRQAIEADPRHAPGYLNLGAALEASGDAATAAGAYRAVLEFDPENPFASYNLAAGMLARRGAPDEAEALLRTALRRKADFPEAHVALSNLLDDAGRHKEAEEHLRAALELRPDFGGAWYNYGLVLRSLERFDEAEDALRRAIQLQPDYAAAHLALAGLLRREARIGEALEACAAARRLAPQSFEVESSELLTLLNSDAVSTDELAARHRQFGARLEAAHVARVRAPTVSRDPERRLRVGYVSSDLHRHPVSLFLLPALERRDRHGFEAHFYSTGTTVDAVTVQLRALSDGWRDAARLTDDELADVIRADGMDILVDLTGHAGALRLGVFAQQPAPVQVSWLGYLHATGLRSIPYRLCDERTDPPGSERGERLVRLPGSQWCYRPFLTRAASTEPPALRNGFVTFGSFNHPAKISPSTRRLWNRLLLRLPESRLLVLGVPAGRAAEQLHRALSADGVDASRVRVLPRLPLDEYFERFNDVDVALDTTPYSGGTTTCDTLWMRVPVVTLPGERSVSRSAASILSGVGLRDWIAATEEHFVSLAAEKARDLGALAELRMSLRERMAASALMDEAVFTLGLEAAYRRMWRDWCENPASPPEG